MALTRLKQTIRNHWNVQARSFDDGDSRVSRTPETEAAWKRTFTDILGEEPLEILDVGSGTGELAFLFSELGHFAQGVDLSPGMVSVSMEKARTRNIHARFRVGDAENLSFPDGSFDVIHARHLMWTLPRPEVAMKEWMRVLRPGGIVLITESFWAGEIRSPWTRLLRSVGRWLVHLEEGNRAAEKIDKSDRSSYPDRAVLPFHGGLRIREAEVFLRGAGLGGVKSRDLVRVRALGRKTLSLGRRLVCRPKTEYYAVWGRKPECAGSAGEMGGVHA